MTISSARVSASFARDAFCGLPGCRQSQRGTEPAGELNDNGSVAARIYQKPLLGRSEIVEELGAHLISNKRCRLSFQQTDRSCLQDIAQVLLRHVRPDHFMERLAVTQGGLRRLLERVIHKPFAAQVQERTMPQIVIRSPFKNFYGSFVGYQ